MINPFFAIHQVVALSNYKFWYKNASKWCRKLSVRTKIIADPETCFQELMSEILLILLRDRPCLKLSIVPETFRLCSSCRTKAMDPPFPEIVAARTVGVYQWVQDKCKSLAEFPARLPCNKKTHRWTSVGTRGEGFPDFWMRQVLGLF